MINIIRVTGFGLSLLISQNIFATEVCNNPTPPLIPDGNIASEDELLNAREAILSYQSRLLEYRTCLNVDTSTTNEETTTSTAKTPEQIKFEQSVEAETKAVEELNQAIRIFKDRG